MEGLGLLIVIGLLILVLVIFDKQRCSDCNEGFEGFEGFQTAQADQTVPANPYWDSAASGPQIPLPTQPTITVPVVGPAPETMTGSKQAPTYTGVSDLPGAPVANLAMVNSIPFQDPRFEKVSTQMLRQLKQDMDGFSANEMPHLQDRSDPAVKLPLTRFQGDYQRVKDELMVVDRTPGFQSQLAVEDLNEMAANLRFLQRTYRVYSDNQMVPGVKGGLSKVGVSKGSPVNEGFDNAPATNPSSQPTYSGDPNDAPISPDQLDLLSNKLTVEVLRLQASGTNDPVLQARVEVFLKIQRAIDGLRNQVKQGTLQSSQIPIKVRDYNAFLPALGDASAGIPKLLSKSGYPTLSSLFAAYDAGDVSGANLAALMFEQYADQLLNGLSYKIDFSYTSPNEVAARQAEASKAAIDAAYGNPYVGYSAFPGASGYFQTNHPMTMDGSRGALDAYTRQLQMQGFQNDTMTPPSSAKAGGFDWKQRGKEVCKNIEKMGLDPGDFGCQKNPDGNSQSSDFSWRGYTKMVCNRLKTVQDTGVPEQCGCPPDSWKGWRT